jgi:hypothetical protein
MFNAQGAIALFAADLAQPSLLSLITSWSDDDYDGQQCETSNVQAYHGHMQCV